MKKRVTFSLDDDVIQMMNSSCAAAHISKSNYISSLIVKDSQDSEKFLEEFQKLISEAAKKLK